MEEDHGDVSPVSSRASLRSRPLLVNEDEIQRSDERQSLVSANNDVSQSQSQDESAPTSDEKATKTAQPTSELVRSKHALHIFVWYAVLAAFTWVCTCVMVYRPLTTARYGYGTKDAYGRASYAGHQKYVTNDNLYLALRTLQSVVALLTIPTTSAICAQGAVIFMQRNKRNAGLTLRQTMVLADKGWIDIGVLGSVISEGWKRFGSRFLLIAVALHILGFAIAPLQQYFVRQESIFTPTWPLQLFEICDFVDHFPPADEYQVYTEDDNLVTVQTRAALASTSNSDPQMRLWQEVSPTCNWLNSSAAAEKQWGSWGSSCTQGGATLVDMATLQRPFLSQIPSGFNTGLVKQFTPRINSTATIDRDITDWPTDCQEGKSSFYTAYSGALGDPALVDYVGFSLEACMPGDQSQPRWRNTRARQDFQEVLYLNISTRQWGPNQEARSLYRVNVSTTGGFFELPNYAHMEPGALLWNGPLDDCGAGCEDQILFKRQATTNSSTLLELESVPNKGPLLTIAMALFGEASFIADRYYQPEAYLASNFDLNESRHDHDPWHCQEMVPFAKLMTPSPSSDFGSATVPGVNPLMTCADNRIQNEGGVLQQIVNYLQLFQVETVQLPNAFNAAAYLANEAWLLNPYETPCTWTVYYDNGAQSQKPSIALAPMIVISFLLLTFLLGLLAVALYSSHSPRWTSQLSSFAMIRIGASIADKVPLKFVNEIDELRVLDEIPGTIGSTESTTTENVDELCLGAPTPLSKNARYCSFDRKLSHQEKLDASKQRYKVVNGKLEPIG